MPKSLPIVSHFTGAGWRMMSLAALMLACMSLGPATAAAQSTPAPGPGDSDPSLYKAVLDDHRDAIYAATEGRLARYRVEATLTPVTDDALATVDGRLDLRFVNETAEALDELYFRLYPNSEEYGDGGMTISALVRDAKIDLSENDTLARLALPEPLPPGGATDLELQFQSILPSNPTGSYGMYAYDRGSGTYALAHWLPLLAGYDPAIGWQLGPLSKHGDPVFSNVALFDVALTAPSELIFVTSGSEVETREGEGTATRRYVTGPVRDFVMAADADYLMEQIAVGGTTVNSYYHPEHAEAGLEVLTAGVQSLEVYNRLFGGYPYAELDLVEVNLGNGAGGVEFPQLMFISSDYYIPNVASIIPGFLEFIVTHEVGHQWWYGLVGNNHYQHAFIDEGLTNYLSTIYFEEVYGAETGRLQLSLNLLAPYLSVLFSEGDQVVDQPTDAFPSQQDYGVAVYAKGALGFQAIHEAIGDEAFFSGLRTYAAEFQFEIASPDDLRTAFERASGQELDELWRHWFEAAEGDRDFDAADLIELLAELGR